MFYIYFSLYRGTWYYTCCALLHGVYVCELIYRRSMYNIVYFTLVFFVNFTKQYFTFVILSLRNVGKLHKKSEAFYPTLRNRKKYKL